MPILSEHSVFLMVAQLGVILLFARIFGEISEKFGQPIIVGEVIAGIILGPAIFGNLLPEQYHSLFPNEGPEPYILQGISWLCVIFLLMITGLEIDLRASLKQGKQGVLISVTALVVSMAAVYSATFLLPEYLYPPDMNHLHVDLLTTIALSVVAIPVIAKILFDLNILRSEVGLKVLTAGVLSDIWGWSIFAVILALIVEGAFSLSAVLKPLLTMIVYLYVTLSFGPKVVDRALNFVGYKEIDTNVALSLLFSLALLNGAIAHLFGIHVIFGAFVAGLMLGESDKITPYVRQSTQDFIFAVFAPIFFVLIGMKMQFSSIESWTPVLILLVASTVFKTAGAYLGAVIGGLGRKNAFAVACGLNTQGTMGIIIALIGYDHGVFNEQLFTIIVLICVLTSLFIGPLMKWAIKGVRRPLAKYFDREHVFLDIHGRDKNEVITNMVALMHERKLIEDTELIEDAIWEREQSLSTAIGEGVALPHARINKLKEPVLCFFRLKHAIDYGSPDNKPVSLLFLELTSKDDEGMQLNLIAQIARFISSEANRNKLLTCRKDQEIHNILSFDEHA